MIFYVLFLLTVTNAQTVRGGGGLETDYVTSSIKIKKWIETHDHNQTLSANLQLIQNKRTSAEIVNGYNSADTAGVKFITENRLDAECKSGEELACILKNTSRVCISDKQLFRTVCNYDLYIKETAQGRYVINLHEHLFLAGIEKTEVELSKYPISKYIGLYVRVVNNVSFLSEFSSKNDELDDLLNHDSCRIWIMGLFNDDSTLITPDIYRTLRSNQYIPLQQTDKKIKNYSYDHPKRGDILIVLQRHEVKAKNKKYRSEVRIDGTPYRLNYDITLVEDLIKESPDSRFFLHPGTLMSADDALQIAPTLSADTYAQKLTRTGPSQIFPDSENGFSKKFQDALNSLVHEMPRCSQLRNIN